MEVRILQVCGDGRELYAAAAEAAGRRRPHIVLPGPVIAPSVWLLDAAQRRLPQRWHYPADREGVEVLRRDTRFDDSAARRGLAIVPVPFCQTMADTVRWLVESGRLPARCAPRLRAEQETFGCPVEPAVRSKRSFGHTSLAAIFASV
jgi:hypothetical protein